MPSSVGVRKTNKYVDTAEESDSTQPEKLTSVLDGSASSRSNSPQAQFAKEAEARPITCASPDITSTNANAENPNKKRRSITHPVDKNNETSPGIRSRHFRTKTAARKVRSRRSTQSNINSTANNNEISVSCFTRDNNSSHDPQRCGSDEKKAAESIVASIEGSQAHNKVKKTPWDVRYSELVEYEKKNGHCLVPARFEENPPLGRWVSLQRVRHRAWKEGFELTSSRSSAMTADQVALLESIGFAWAVKNEWDLRYQQLVEYKKKHSNCLVPARFKENQSLGQWVASQRMRYRARKDGMKTFRGGTAVITERQVAMLNKIEFVWEVRRSKKG